VDVAGVESALGSIPQVCAVHDLHIWTVGSGMVALSAHLVVDEPSACDNDAILAAAKRALVEGFGIDHSTLQIETRGHAGSGVRWPPRAVRIGAGPRRGSRLAGPKGPRLRPTADRVRESLFNRLGQFFEGGEVLDLYAGTGAFSFEALSRGMAKA